MVFPKFIKREAGAEGNAIGSVCRGQATLVCTRPGHRQVSDIGAEPQRFLAPEILLY